MAQLSTKVELYVGRNVDFRKEVVLRQDGGDKEPYIAEWNIEYKNKPTIEELDAFEAEADIVDQNTIIKTSREAAMREFLPDEIVISAMLEQAKADREEGKTLMPDLEEAVNLYIRILADNPEPG